MSVKITEKPPWERKEGQLTVKRQLFQEPIWALASSFSNHERGNQREHSEADVDNEKRDVALLLP